MKENPKVLGKGLCFMDTETTGFCGPAVLIQYAYDDGPILLHHIWSRPCQDTIELIEEMMNWTIVGYNLTFDSFQLQKIYNMLAMLRKQHGPEAYPSDHIDWLGEIEHDSCMGDCIKPVGVIDLMLVGRRGPLQMLMERKNVYVRKIPKQIAPSLQRELEMRVHLEPILFARKKIKQEYQWQIEDIVVNGKTDANFVNLVLRFAPSGGLKHVAEYLGITGDAPPTMFSSAAVDKEYSPVEKEHAPYATAIGRKAKKKIWDDDGSLLGELLCWDWRGAWPEVISRHINHWALNPIAKQYASDDIKYTRGVYAQFNDNESLGCDEDDSVIAWSVGVTRWRGFDCNAEGLKAQAEVYAAESKKSPKDPGAVLRMLTPHLSDIELSVLKDDRGKISTKKGVLEILATWDTKAGRIAKAVIAARKAENRRNLCMKLVEAGRIHPDFKVVGAKSGRMSGTGGINFTGIPRDKNIKKHFTFADKAEDGLVSEDEVLQGGDFDAQEVALLVAAYPDPKLEAVLRSGVKIHTLMAEKFYPNLTREEIVASKGCDPDYYGKGKNGTFAITYLAQPQKVADTNGITLEHAEKSLHAFKSDYIQMATAQMKYVQSLTAMQQLPGSGKIVWRDIPNKATSLFGFSRYFDSEIKVMKALYDIANSPPPEWKQVNVRVQRRDKVQTASGAAQSAVFGAAFGICGQILRAGNNHRIQSSGSHLTKRTQRRVWDLQPCGISPWLVRMISVHDELMIASKAAMAQQVKATVDATVESFRSVVSLISLKLAPMKNWAEKA